MCSCIYADDMRQPLYGPLSGIPLLSSPLPLPPPVQENQLRRNPPVCYNESRRVSICYFLFYFHRPVSSVEVICGPCMDVLFSSQREHRKGGRKQTMATFADLLFYEVMSAQMMICPNRRRCLRNRSCKIIACCCVFIVRTLRNDLYSFCC